MQQVRRNAGRRAGLSARVDPCRPTYLHYYLSCYIILYTSLFYAILKCFYIMLGCSLSICCCQLSNIINSVSSQLICDVATAYASSATVRSVLLNLNLSLNINGYCKNLDLFVELHIRKIISSFKLS